MPNWLSELLELQVDQQPYFYLVYGYWTGDGSIAVKDADGTIRYITFATYKDADLLTQWFAKLGLEEGVDYFYSDMPAIEDGPLEKRRARLHLFNIKHPDWLSLFSDNYIHRYGSGPGSRTNPSAARRYVEYPSQHSDFVKPGTAKSAKCFASHIWEQDTDKSALQFLLVGLHAADGSAAPYGLEKSYTPHISISCVSFRDQIQLLVLRTERATRFFAQVEEGTESTINSTGQTVTRRSDNWTVTFSQSLSRAEPRAQADEIKKFSHTGDIYVLEVPVGHGIFVRKVPKTGEVTKAGMPSIVGPIRCDGDGLDELVAVPGEYAGMRKELTLEELKRLARTHNSAKEAAAGSGISGDTLRRKCKKYGVTWGELKRQAQQ
ncbi:hypothetical protein Ndes2526B_g01711 [Nannochloris sp. 'desiccata']